MRSITGCALRSFPIRFRCCGRARRALTFVLGAVFALGMASTFKYVADDCADNMGVVTG
ncbi:hypothetical protein [Burkholderia metallica]|uniref:hypothetical protein n=1 Tax=Burkholderia metallica TaxID=488729 RepID=UPI0015757BEB|nr:hypothetical protein [Burkholderia metallica]